MTSDIPERCLDRTESFLLCGLCITLPGFEAPKNIFLFLFLFYWALRRALAKNRAKAFGENDWLFDGPLVTIVLLGLLSSVLSESPTSSLLNGLDFFSIVTLAIILRRTTLSDTQLIKGLSLVFVGIVVALLDAHYRRNLAFPSLHSVGHINHVAIYLATSVSAFLGLAWRSRGVKSNIYLVISFVLIWVTTETESRNTAFGLLLIIFIIAALILLLDKKWMLSTFLLTMMVFATGAVVLTKPVFYTKQISELQHDSLDRFRYRILKTSWIVGGDRPLLGHGVGEWQSATRPEFVRELSVRHFGLYNADEYFFTTHGHNLAATWYVERGVFALFALLIFVVLTSIRFYLRLKSHPISPGPSVGLLSLLTVVTFGMGNTTLHHEHGMLAMALVGIGMRLCKPSNASGV